MNPPIATTKTDTEESRKALRILFFPQQGTQTTQKIRKHITFEGALFHSKKQNAHWLKTKNA